MDLIQKIESLRYDIENGVETDVINISVRLIQIKDQLSKQTDIINSFSGDNLIKLQKQFVSLYGSDEISQEKANSFAVGFGKACELICKDLENKFVIVK
jgi:hypothetical protein